MTTYQVTLANGMVRTFTQRYAVKVGDTMFAVRTANGFDFDVEIVAVKRVPAAPTVDRKAIDVELEAAILAA